MGRRYRRSAGTQPAHDAGTYVVNLAVTGLLRQELADGLGPVAGAADNDDRLIRTGDRFDLVQPGNRIGPAAFVEEGEQVAAGDDTGLFPFGLQADIDDRYALLKQLGEFPVVDVDHFGPGKQAKAGYA